MTNSHALIAFFQGQPVVTLFLLLGFVISWAESKWPDSLLDRLPELCWCRLRSANWGLGSAPEHQRSGSHLTQQAKSSVPALGYTGTYALASIISTIAGTLILYV